MSFISQHIAKQTDTHDPVIGPDSPHFDSPHHQALKDRYVGGHTERLATETIQDKEGNHVPLKPYEHQEYPKMLHAKNSAGEAITLIVADNKEHAEAKAIGWKESA